MHNSIVGGDMHDVKRQTLLRNNSILYQMNCPFLFKGSERFHPFDLFSGREPETVIGVRFPDLRIYSDPSI